jgi:hypothetical protein
MEQGELRSVPDGLVFANLSETWDQNPTETIMATTVLKIVNGPLAKNKREIEEATES